MPAIGIASNNNKINPLITPTPAPNKRRFFGFSPVSESFLGLTNFHRIHEINLNTVKFNNHNIINKMILITILTIPKINSSDSVPGWNKNACSGIISCKIRGTDTLRVVISVVISPDINELTKLKLISNINSEMNGIANAPITSASRKKSVINDVFKNPLIKP